MKIEWIPGAAVIALVMCGSMFAQDCGCNGFGNSSGYVGSGRAVHAWTYDQAAGLWDGYCSEQPACRIGCGLLNGCNTGCASRWPASCSDCNSGCGGSSNSGASSGRCGINFGSLRGVFGSRCGKGCSGSLISRAPVNSGCGCNGGGNFGFANQGCGCNDGGCCSGHRHSLDLFGGLRSRGGCDSGCGALPGVGGCGCNGGAQSGCGCN